MSIKQFLVGLQNQAKKMQDFEHFGMQRIAQSVPEADGVCNFQHLFVIHDRQPNLASKDFWKEEQLEIASLNQYPLILECYLNELDLELAVRFDETVIEAHQLEMILASFKHIINQLIAGPGTQPLNKLSMLSEQDQQAIIQMNQTMPIGMEKRIDELFDIQRLAQPNAEAVSGFDASFTYQELYDLSIRLGHHLQEMGIGPEVLVPLLFDKSAWTVVAMLGVLFAGGGFIPMDATHPVHRFQQIIEDSNAPLVLASQSRKDLCKTIAPQTFVVSPETIKALPRQRSPPANNATPRNTAYILFTSGSTGKPKGVVTEHRGICTAAIEQAPRINLNANSRVLSYSSYAFEVTILETFHTLFHGGCVCPISQGQRMNDLVGAINQLKTNWAFFTPSLVRTFTPEQVPCMKTVILGGEALGADNIEVWANKTHLGNGYGPTETCVFSSILDRITENDRPDNIGKAVGGVCWITSAEDHNVLVPIGAVGELLIEGPTVARGYLNDPVKTEKAFIERPVWLNEHALRRPVERVYKTGKQHQYTTNHNSL
jgi:amino acid adenylation domain-containing protein